MSTTTDTAIRDRMIAVIGQLTASSLAGDAFVAYRNEGGADFKTWASSNPDAAWRRFQVRFAGDADSPETTNGDIEEQHVDFVVLVAYPWSSRAGVLNALDRDTVMRQDRDQILKAIGIDGAANFAGANPDACYRGGHATFDNVGEVDFIVITQTMSFYRVA